MSRLSDAVAESKIAALDLASKYDELGSLASGKLSEDFGSYGLEVSRFYIENMSLPAEVEAAIDQRSKLGVLGDRLQPPFLAIDPDLHRQLRKLAYALSL